jgi:hypothetical protein
VSNAVVVGAPGAPTGVTAASGNEDGVVSFTAPPANGSAITSYTVTASPGGETATGSASPITVPGLTNGTAYTFTVTATNGVGTGPPSAPSSAIVAGAPPPPTDVDVAPGNGQATVTFTIRPVTQGMFGPITYTVTASPGDETASGGDSSITVGGLTNGTQYSFTVTASDSVATSAPTAPVEVIAGSPDMPTAVTAEAGGAQATVSFTPGSQDAAPITGYVVTIYPGEQTVTGTSSPITVNGLTNGDPYTFRVAGVNKFGTGPRSGPSNSVTPNS